MTERKTTENYDSAADMPVLVDGTRPKLHIVMFPWLAFGHIVPFAQLARKIAAADAEIDITVSILSAAGNVSRIKGMLAGTVVGVIPFQLPSIPGLPPGAENTAEVSLDGAELLKIALDQTRPEVSDILHRLRPDLVAVDFTPSWITDIARPLGIKTLQFSVFSAVIMSWLSVPSRCPVDGSNGPSVEDLMKPPADFPDSSRIRSVPAYQASSFHYMFQRFNGQPSVFDRVMAGQKAHDAVMIKTCRETEGLYVDYFASQTGKRVLITGPTVPASPNGELEPRWNKWLGKFPKASTVFCSFGSETFLSDESVRELLLGLEDCGFPFFVVLNFPAAGGHEGEELEKRVPPGFLDRVKGRGIVHSGWVQQQHILRHPSVGCFLCHAGFSSLVEGLVGDCRLAMLPQKGDQFLNSTLFVREMGIGVEVERREEDGWFGKDDVRKAVTSAMSADVDELERYGKWKEFFMDEKVEENCIVQLVKNMRELALE